MRLSSRLLAIGAGLLVAGAFACGSSPSASDETPAPPDEKAPADPAETPVRDAGSGEAPLIGTFPRNFLFGTAIAGFQVDMGCPTVAAASCEDRASDWYQWITTPRILDNPLLFMSKAPPTSGPGFFELYEKDLERAAGKDSAGLGNTAVRLSIEWSRIFPNPTWGIGGVGGSHAALAAVASKAGIDYYHRIFAAMKARGLTPFVTLNHYSLPLWVHDGNACNESLADCITAKKAGWADPDRSRIVNEIAKYAAFVAEEYGGEVDRWATLNEPFSAVVVAGYLVSSPMRSNPPGLSGPWANIDGAKTAFTAMIEAHAKMYDAVKAFDSGDADGDGKKSEVGIVYAYSEIVPNSDAPADVQAAKDARYFFEDMFMDGVALGRLDADWSGSSDGLRTDLVNRLDFVGVNYYFRFRAKPSTIPLSAVIPIVTFDMLAPFEAAPRGIYPALKSAAKYRKPIYVTETGATQEDEARGAAWVVQSLSEVHRAIGDGLDIRGYFAWSLMDNYEWNHGMDMRFGLYAVNPYTKERAMRDSGEVYARIAKERDVAADLEMKYASYFP